MEKNSTPFGSGLSDQDIPHATPGAHANARRTAHSTPTDEQRRLAKGESTRTLATLIT
jgi:hypothetical protein